MSNSLLSFFNRIKSLDGMLELRKSNGKDVIFRDELVSKKQKTHGSTNYSENSEPLINRELEYEKRSLCSAAEQQGAVMRVKVKMTKQQAARMLSKCKNGGVLEFKDVARELVQIPRGRVSVESSPGACCVAGPILKTIPEEF